MFCADIERGTVRELEADDFVIVHRFPTHHRNGDCHDGVFVHAVDEITTAEGSDGTISRWGSNRGGGRKTSAQHAAERTGAGLVGLEATHHGLHGTGNGAADLGRSTALGTAAYGRVAALVLGLTWSRSANALITIRVSSFTLVAAFSAVEDVVGEVDAPPVAAAMPIAFCDHVAVATFITAGASAR